MSSQGEPGSNEETLIKLKIKTLQPATYEVEVPYESFISELKATLAAITDVPAERQRLIYRGRVLNDNQRLNEQGVEDGHTLHLVERPEGSAAPPPTSHGLQDASQAARGSSRIAVGTVSLDGGTGADFERFVSGLLQSLSQQGAVAIPVGMQLSTTTTMPAGHPILGEAGSAVTGQPAQSSQGQNWVQLGTQLGYQIAQQIMGVRRDTSQGSMAPPGGPSQGPPPLGISGHPWGSFPVLPPFAHHPPPNAPGLVLGDAAVVPRVGADNAQRTGADRWRRDGGPPPNARPTRHALASLHRYLTTLQQQSGRPLDTAQPFSSIPRGLAHVGLYVEGLREVLTGEVLTDDVQRLLDTVATAVPPHTGAGPPPAFSAPFTPAQAATLTTLTQLAFSTLLSRLASFVIDTMGPRVRESATQMQEAAQQHLNAEQPANISGLTRVVAAELYRTAVALMEMNRLLSMMALAETPLPNPSHRVPLLPAMYINQEGTHPRRNGPPVAEIGGVPMLMGMGVNMAVPSTSASGHTQSRWGVPVGDTPPSSAPAAPPTTTAAAPPVSNGAPGINQPGVPPGFALNPIMSAIQSAISTMVSQGPMGPAEATGPAADATTAQQAAPSGPMPATSVSHTFSFGPSSLPWPLSVDASSSLPWPISLENVERSYHNGPPGHMPSGGPPLGSGRRDAPAPWPAASAPPLGATRSTASQTGQQVPGNAQTAAVTIQISNGADVGMDMGGLLAGLMGGQRPDTPGVGNPFAAAAPPPAATQAQSEARSETQGGPAPNAASSWAVWQALISMLTPVVGTIAPTIVNALSRRVTPQMMEAFMNAFQSGAVNSSNLMERIAGIFNTSVDGIVEQIFQTLNTVNGSAQTTTPAAENSRAPGESRPSQQEGSTAQQPAGTTPLNAPPSTTPPPAAPTPMTSATVLNRSGGESGPSATPQTVDSSAVDGDVAKDKGKSTEKKSTTMSPPGLGLSLPSRRPAAKVTPSKRPAASAAQRPTAAPAANSSEGQPQPQPSTAHRPATQQPPGEDPLMSLMSGLLGGGGGPPPGARSGGPGGPGRGGGGPGGGLFQMAAQMLQNPAVQNTMQQMLSGPEDGAPPDFGAMMQSAMPMMQQMFGAMGGGAGGQGERGMGRGRGRGMPNGGVVTPDAVHEELQRMLDSREEARHWFDVIRRDVSRQMQPAGETGGLSNVYMAGYRTNTSSSPSIFEPDANEQM